MSPRRLLGRILAALGLRVTPRPQEPDLEALADLARRLDRLEELMHHDPFLRREDAGDEANVN